MKVEKWLKSALSGLSQVGIETAQLDSLVLLEDVLHTNRAHLLAHPELEVTTEQQNTLAALIERRAQHEPLAYIRGNAEFYGREFIVTHDVLIPRPETEAMIELLIDFSRQNSIESIIDLGTGSGALAITAKLELPQVKVTATDISAAALAVAHRNAQTLEAEIAFTTADLAKSLPKQVLQPQSIILANLPYVPDDYPINQAASHEPKIALFAGADGLDLYRPLFKQLNDSQPGSTIFTEVLASQHPALQAIAELAGYKLIKDRGLIQQFTRS